MPNPHQASIRSEKNARRLENVLHNYDTLLKVLFYPKQGFYIIARPYMHDWEDNASEILKDDETVYSFAFRRRLLVVAQPPDPDDLQPLGKAPHPLSVAGMENFDRCLPRVLAHLRINDMKGLATTGADRIREAARKLDEDDASRSGGVEKFHREEMQALGRDYFRSKILPKSYIPRGD